MHIFEVKQQVRNLEKSLQKRGVEKPYAEILEMVAEMHGLKNWQVLRALSDDSALPGLADLPYVEKGGVIDTLVLEKPDGSQLIYELHLVDTDDLLEYLDREIQGVASAEDRQVLDDCANTIVFDWGDEFEGEGLEVHELRGARQVREGVWKLKDGTLLSFTYPERYPGFFQSNKDRETLAILECDMTDLFDYGNPNDVPEWQWVEANAAFSHRDNGNPKIPGVWEFMVNVRNAVEEEYYEGAIPQVLKPIFAKARREKAVWVLFHQG